LRIVINIVYTLISQITIAIVLLLLKSLLFHLFKKKLLLSFKFSLPFLFKLLLLKIAQGIGYIILISVQLLLLSKILVLPLFKLFKTLCTFFIKRLKVILFLLKIRKF